MPQQLIGNYNWLLSAESTLTGVPTTSLVMDARKAANYGYLVYQSTSPSAVIGLDASHDGTAFSRVLTVTAIPTIGTAQISAYYPYLRGVVASAMGGGGNTGSASLFYGAGLRSVAG